MNIGDTQMSLNLYSTQQKQYWNRKKRATIRVKSQIYTDNEATRIIQPSPLLENDEDLLICPAISSTQNNKHMVQISNFLDHPYTLKKGTHIANFSILTPEQTKHIRPVNPTSVRHLLNNSHDDAIHYINSVLKTSKKDEVNETYWFPTPQNPGNEKEHTPIQTRNLNELRELEQLEKLNPLKKPTLETNFYPISIGQILLYNWKSNKPLKTYLWNFTTFLHGTALRSESIQSSKYNSHS